MKSRIISGVIAVAYLIGAYLTNGGETTFKVGIFLVLPLACIWFSDAMGGYTGLGMGNTSINSTTPGWLVAAGGWLLLALPVIIALVIGLSGKK